MLIYSSLSIISIENVCILLVHNKDRSDIFIMTLESYLTQSLSIVFRFSCNSSLGEGFSV